MLVTHDSFAIPKQVKAAFEQESGLKLRILQGGDAGESRQPRAADEGQPAGRRPLRDRQQPALARARRGPVRAVRGDRASTRVDGRYRLDPTHRVTPDRPRRRLPQHRQELVRVPRHRPAEDARRPDEAALPQAARRREPRHLDAGARVHARHRRPLRRERLAGLLAPSCARTACSSSTAGRRRTRPVLRRGRQQGQAADRRLLRDEPGGGGDLRQEAARDGADRRRRATAASARSSSPACSPARRTWRARAR